MSQQASKNVKCSETSRHLPSFTALLKQPLSFRQEQQSQTQSESVKQKPHSDHHKSVSQGKERLNLTMSSFATTCQWTHTVTLWGLSTKRPLQFKVITWITSDISMKASWCSAVSKANYLQTLKRSHCCGYKWVQLWIWTPNHNGLIKMEKVPPIIILSRATGMIKVLPKWNLMHNQ